MLRVALKITGVGCLFFGGVGLAMCVALAAHHPAAAVFSAALGVGNLCVGAFNLSRVP